MIAARFFYIPGKDVTPNSVFSFVPAFNLILIWINLSQKYILNIGNTLFSHLISFQFKDFINIFLLFFQSGGNFITILSIYPFYLLLLPPSLKAKIISITYFIHYLFSDLNSGQNTLTN